MRHPRFGPTAEHAETRTRSVEQHAIECAPHGKRTTIGDDRDAPRQREPLGGLRDPPNPARVDIS